MPEFMPLKYDGAAENEVHPAPTFDDRGHCVVSPVAIFSPEIALGVVTTLSAAVTAGHRLGKNRVPDEDGITWAQMFEEGAVLMTASPFDDFSADRYLMDFYDVQERDICSRMHFHTGMRYVRMMTGPDTRIRVSALSPIRVNIRAPRADVELHTFQDLLPHEGDGSGDRIVRFNLVVPECAWVDMQIARGTSHQFNAIGPNAVIDTVHPEESIEIFRERVGRINMMAQTIFLEQDPSPAQSCSIDQPMSSDPEASRD